MKRPVAAEVVAIDNRTAAGHSLRLALAEGWREPPQPGRFVMLWLPRPPAGHDPRACDAVPMSIAGWEPGRLRVTIADAGPTTAALLACEPGHRLGVLGPLGRGFSLDARRPLLVAGGVGAPPLLWLAQRLAAQGAEPTTLLGARTADELFHRDEFPGRVVVATDDGSAGHHGFVTDLLADAGGDRLYACGPEPMLVKALAWTREHAIPGEFCLERHMACGVGLCGVCSLDGDLVCQDGPVFDAERLARSREFGRVVRGPGGRVR